MTGALIVKSYAAPPIDRREILRYAGVRGEDAQAEGLLSECLGEALPSLDYRAVVCRAELSLCGDVVTVGAMRLASRSLAERLSGCRSCAVMAATVGLSLDRLIAKYSRLSPARALMLQAIGTERVEALCDAVCRDIADGLFGAPCAPLQRFSPGYGDLALECQRDIFMLLDCPRRIGLSLNESLLMSPSKSVTAIVGLGDEVNQK